MDDQLMSSLGVSDALATYCAAAFASLSRTDQRRWARVYLRGLLEVTGRKSLRRMAGHAGLDGCDQALQQFLNQSPWDPIPVRQTVGASLMDAIQPIALVADEVVFAKNGRLSPGVDRQYVRSVGKVVNCQLAMVVSVSDGWNSFPLDWNLMLPESWDADQHRRARAYVPPGEQYRPCWQHAVEMLDDVSGWPSVPPVPVVVEAPIPAEARNLLHTLHRHRHGFVIGVNQSMTAVPIDPDIALVPRQLPGGPTPGRDSTLAGIVRSVPEDRRHLVMWDKPDGGVARSRFVTAPVAVSADDGSASVNALLLAECPLRKDEPSQFWLTNLVDRKLTDLVRLAKLPLTTVETTQRMGHDFGLWDFEGRSFRGWHHHVTLSSAAYGFSLLTDRPVAEGLRGGRNSSGSGLNGLVQPGSRPDPQRHGEETA